MSAWTIILLGFAAWILLIAGVKLVVVPWLSAGPRADPLLGLLWRVDQMFSRLLHHARFLGMHDLRVTQHPGPLIVVSNHTGAVDPLLIQAGCRFHIRWLMASEMMSPLLKLVWSSADPIPVDRDGRDSGPAREAIRHVQGGGVIGIFPEGRIVRPPRQIRPFFLGVGLIVARAKAPVLLVWVSGTPDTTNLWRSLLTPSRARVEYVERIDFSHVRDAHEITRQLRARLSAVSGWELNDAPVPPSLDEETH